MIETIAEWFRQGVHLAVVLSVVFVAGGLVLYLLLRRRISRSPGSERPETTQRVLLGLAILLLVVVGLGFAWRGHVESLRNLDQWFRKNAVYWSLLWTLVAGVVVFLVARGVEQGMLEGAGDMEARHKIRRGVYWGRTVVFIACVVLIWQNRIQNIGVFLGIVGAGVAMSLQEALLCIAGWILLVTKKPFDLGDRIEIGGHVGDVIDVTVFQTSILEVGHWIAADQSTGRIIHMPNSMVLRNVVANYTKGFPFIWNELQVVVTFESDWRRAKDIMLRQAQQEAEKIETEVGRQVQAMQGHYAIRYQRLTPIVYTTIADQGVALTLRYLTPVRKRRGTTHEICEGILEAFAKESTIDFAYPTTRFYNNVKEGKSGTGGPPPSQGARE